jgi:hypothetical protein
MRHDERHWTDEASFAHCCFILPSRNTAMTIAQKLFTVLCTYASLVTPVPMQRGRSLQQGCVCTEQYDPVCDASGHKYSNACMARCQVTADEALIACPVNCCAGGDACGYVHCKALGGNPAVACVQPWAMPLSMSWPASCSTPSPPPPPPCLRDAYNACVPTSCIRWYDGCNQCMVSQGALLCTRRACLTQQGKPYCVHEFH